MRDCKAKVRAGGIAKVKYALRCSDGRNQINVAAVVDAIDNKSLARLIFCRHTLTQDVQHALVV